MPSERDKASVDLYAAELELRRKERNRRHVHSLAFGLILLASTVVLAPAGFLVSVKVGLLLGFLFLNVSLLVTMLSRGWR